MNNELYHYGVPGMRWGKRKKILKQEYKSRVKKENNDYEMARIDRKLEKKEFKTYMKEMDKSGRPGSKMDKMKGGRSTELYNRITAKKGKEYADKVTATLGKKYTRDNKVANAVLIASAATLVGITISNMRDKSKIKLYDFKNYKIT